MQIARLIKTTRTKLGRTDCVISWKDICENTKRSQANRKQRSEDLSIYQPYLKALCSVPCYFLAPDHMPCRSTLLMVSILSLFFGIVYAYGSRTYSVVTSFGVLVDSTQGNKTTLLPLHRPFLWDYLRPALYSFRLKKKKKRRKPRYFYGLNWRDKHMFPEICWS